MSALRQMSVSQLSALLADSSAEAPLLLDVREPWEYQIAKIAGSENLPMGQISGRVDSLDQTRSTVVICHHGTRSLQVVAFLQQQGFTNLHNLQGGIDAWSRTVDPSIAIY
jgi:rhodanese-related sulfurtransferase